MNLVLSPVSKLQEKANKASCQAIWEGIKDEVVNGTHRVLSIEFTDQEWDDGMRDVVLTDKLWYSTLTYPTTNDRLRKMQVTTIGHWMSVPVKVLYPL